MAAAGSSVLFPTGFHFLSWLPVPVPGIQQVSNPAPLRNIQRVLNVPPRLRLLPSVFAFPPPPQQSKNDDQFRGSQNFGKGIFATSMPGGLTSQMQTRNTMQYVAPKNPIQRLLCDKYSESQDVVMKRFLPNTTLRNDNKLSEFDVTILLNVMQDGQLCLMRAMSTLFMKRESSCNHK